MGAAVGDYDGDGRDDLFVTGWRDQRLYRNAGGGRFLDVTERAGLTSRLWSTSAAFADLDRDGDLDLYVANYVDFDPATAPFCAAPDGRRDYCAPEDFEAQPDRLYRNDGDGRFTDVSGPAGIALAEGRGLGVLVADLVGDSRLDVFVANDGDACRLFENRGGMQFEEVGLAAGVAFDGRGNPLAGMGVALGDLDGDGRSDLVVTNFLDRSTVAFQSLGAGAYRDSSAPLGISGATRGVLGFGIAAADFDGDGRTRPAPGQRPRPGPGPARRPLRHAAHLAPEPGGEVRRRLGHGRPGLPPADPRPRPGRRRPRPRRPPRRGDQRPRLPRPRAPQRHSRRTLAHARTRRPARRVRPSAHGSARPSPAGSASAMSSAAAATCRPPIAGSTSGLGEARRVDRLDVTWPSGRAETLGRLARWRDDPARGGDRVGETMIGALPGHVLVEYGGRRSNADTLGADRRRPGRPAGRRRPRRPLRVPPPRSDPCRLGDRVRAPAGFRRAHAGTPPGTWSDDGAQALALLSSLLDRGRLDPEDLGRRLLEWYDLGRFAVDRRVFDVGIQTGTALRALREGTPALEAGPAEERTNGNGSLMRVLPLALWHLGSDAELVADARLQSRVTHGHLRSQAMLRALLPLGQARPGRIGESVERGRRHVARALGRRARVPRRAGGVDPAGRSPRRSRWRVCRGLPPFGPVGRRGRSLRAGRQGGRRDRQ